MTLKRFDRIHWRHAETIVDYADQTTSACLDLDPDDLCAGINSVFNKLFDH